MRTRNMGYADYGITKEEKKYIKKFCEHADENEKEIIKQALSELNHYIVPYIYDSLVEKKSYESIIKKEFLFMGKEDFYGYRRKGMEAIKRYMISFGKWKL